MGWYYFYIFRAIKAADTSVSVLVGFPRSSQICIRQINAIVFSQPDQVTHKFPFPAMLWNNKSPVCDSVGKAYRAHSSEFGTNIGTGSVEIWLYISLPSFWESENISMLFVRWSNHVKEKQTEYSCYYILHIYSLKMSRPRSPKS